MNKIMITALLFVLSLNLFSQKRYLEECFSTVDIQRDFKFGENYNVDGALQSLKFDIYLPANDNEALRPLIIMIHGGTYMTGDKDDDYVVNFCNVFSKRGYAVAAVEYRKGVAGYNLSEFSRAAYRAIQDAKSAVRYFKANGSQFDIDTAQIFLMGFSSGAITAIHYAFMNQSNAATAIDTTGLGKLDESTGNLGYSNSIKAIVSFAGAIIDTSWISSNGLPNLLYHGTADEVVPIDEGYAMGMFKLYGSRAVNRVSKSFGLKSELYVFEGIGHSMPEDQTDVSDSVINTASRFLYSLLDPKTDVSEENFLVSNNEINIYPNPVSDEVKISLPQMFENDNLQIELYDYFGKRIAHIYSGKSKQTLTFSLKKININQEIYFLRIRLNNKEINKLIQYIK